MSQLKVTSSIFGQETANVETLHTYQDTPKLKMSATVSTQLCVRAALHIANQQFEVMTSLASVKAKAYWITDTNIKSLTSHVQSL